MQGALQAGSHQSLIWICNCLVKFCIDLYFYRHIPGGQYPISPASTDSFAKLQYLNTSNIYLNFNSDIVFLLFSCCIMFPMFSAINDFDWLIDWLKVFLWIFIILINVWIVNSNDFSWIFIILINVWIVNYYNDFLCIFIILINDDWFIIVMNSQWIFVNCVQCVWYIC